MIQLGQVISRNDRMRRVSATDRRRRPDAVRLPSSTGRSRLPHWIGAKLYGPIWSKIVELGPPRNMEIKRCTEDQGPRLQHNLQQGVAFSLTNSRNVKAASWSPPILHVRLPPPIGHAGHQKD